MAQNVERVSVSYRDGKAEVVHTVIERSLADGQSCWLRQQFMGKFEHGVLVASANGKLYQPAAQGCPARAREAAQRDDDDGPVSRPGLTRLVLAIARFN